MGDRGQNSYFVECILFLFGGQIEKFDFFQGVDVIIFEPDDFVDNRVSSFTEFAEYMEILW